METENHDQTSRAGRYIRQIGGYRAFVPKPLPPSPPLHVDDELLGLLSRADQALGRLDASAAMLPNPDLFVRMYVRKEAVLSSQIEGTQASLTDVLEYEASVARRRRRSDASEVVNYVKAMNFGLERLGQLPLSNRLIREIHAQLIQGVRGQHSSPGEFRSTQNWIGPPGCDLSTAAFVPPTPHEMQLAMGELEGFIQKEDSNVPSLIKIGLIHSQFETIHPFLDGNGRMGRLLITFFLCQQGVLKRPLLYLSAYFKEQREQYYGLLQAVRDSGAWEQWLKFFLTAAWHVSRDASETARRIIRMREQHRQAIQAGVPGSVKGVELLDHLFEHPYITVGQAAGIVNISQPTANNLVRRLSDLGILREITGQRRGRIFKYEPYLELLEAGIQARTPNGM